MRLHPRVLVRPRQARTGVPNFRRNREVRLRPHRPARRTLIDRTRTIATTPLTATARTGRTRPPDPRGPSPKIHRIKHGIDVRIKTPRHRNTRRLSGSRPLGHRGIRLRIRPRTSTNAQPCPLRIQPGRQLPRKPHRPITTHLSNLHRHQSHHIIQRHIRAITRQRHHIMSPLHNPHRSVTGPTHRPRPLNLPTQIRLRPPRHSRIR